MKQESALVRATKGTGKSIDFSGVWVNELNSTMTLKQTSSQLSGEYASAVSSDGTSTKGDLLGFVDGDLLSVTVHWRDFQAITAWVGQLATDQATLHTLWQMTKQVGAGEEWASINAGADTFSRRP